jgi:preprotein translocase subunit SecD
MNNKWRIVLIWASAAGLVLLVAGTVWFLLPRGGGGREDIDRLGGTILVYELERPPARDEDVQRLVTVLQRQIDEAGLRHVTVRSGGNDRVELLVPRVGDHPWNVGRVKELIPSGGASVEFRILAHPKYDENAVLAVREKFERLDADPGLARDLEARAARGQPPPAPLTVLGKPDFRVTGRFGDELGLFPYDWVEISPTLLVELGLDEPRDEEGRPIENPTREDARAAMETRNWWTAREARDKAVALELSDGGRTLVLYSRDVPKARREEKGARHEYFLLVRGFDAPERRLSGEVLESVRASALKPEVVFNLTAEGGKLFEDFTRKNIDQQFAVVVDGLVVFSANIADPISKSGRISGHEFTEAYVKGLAARMRAGTLPLPLKPGPVAEREVQPGGKR